MIRLGDESTSLGGDLQTLFKNGQHLEERIRCVQVEREQVAYRYEALLNFEIKKDGRSGISM